MLLFQLAEMKKKLDEALATIESQEDAKKKSARDAEQLQDRITALVADNDKINKSKKKLESEVCLELYLLMVNLPNIARDNYLHVSNKFIQL